MKITYWQGFAGWYVTDETKLKPRRSHLLSNKSDKWVSFVYDAYFPSLEAAKEGFQTYLKNHPEELATYIAEKILCGS